MMNYELKRVVATDDDHFSKFIHSQNNVFEVMPNISAFAKMQFPDLSDIFME